MFKVKTRSQLKQKKVFSYYMVRRVNNVWEMASPFHKVQAASLDECARAILMLEKADSPGPKPGKNQVKKKSKPRKKAKK